MMKKRVHTIKNAWDMWEDIYARMDIMSGVIFTPSPEKLISAMMKWKK